MSAVSSEFDIFTHRPVQTSVLGTTRVAYKPLAPVSQGDLEFSIPASSDTYIDPNIYLYVRCKLVQEDGTDFKDETDKTAVVNNLLHSLFSQCNVQLNGVPITQASDLYNYRAYLETLLTYGKDAAESHLTSAYWYPDSQNMQACDPTAAATTNNRGFISRWERCKHSKEIELYGRVHADICNVPHFILPGVRIQFRFTKARQAFFLMHYNSSSSVQLKFLDAQLFVNHIKPNPAILMAHNAVLLKGEHARYNVRRVEVKMFTFPKGSKSLSIDNAAPGSIPKRLTFAMVKNTDFVGSIESNPYMLRHYDIESFALYVGGQQIPNEGLRLDMSHEKTSVMGYKTLFEGSGIHHSDQGLQITHDMYINGYFMLVYDLTPDKAASEGHTSNPESGPIRIEARFAKELPDTISCLLYLEYDNCVRIDYNRTVSTDF